MQPPIVIEGADSAVICTDEATPVIVGKDIEGKVFVVKAGDKSFALMLQSLGYRQDEVPEVTQAVMGG